VKTTSYVNVNKHKVKKNQRRNMATLAYTLKHTATRAFKLLELVIHTGRNPLLPLLTDCQYYIIVTNIHYPRENLSYLLPTVKVIRNSAHDYDN